VFPLGAAGALDDPDRERWQRPDEVIEALAIEPGARLADIGCGTGYFTLRLLEAAGPAGTVTAVDIQQGMLDLLARRLREADRARVVLRCTAPGEPLASGDDVDLALCANTLNEVDEEAQAAFVSRLAAGLAPGGRLAVIEWLPKPTGLGPPVGQRLAPERIRALAEAAGLVLTEEHTLLPMHSFLVFRKPE
jgi:ubiquinone/menaquinone biosynthesis C-methylase UbiE